MSQCTYRCVVLPDFTLSEAFPEEGKCLNAPTGAWCSLTGPLWGGYEFICTSQCTYRCVVLPDDHNWIGTQLDRNVSMHLQVRGAP